MSDGRRKWNTSENSFRHKTISDDSEKKSPLAGRRIIPSINIPTEYDDNLLSPKVSSSEQGSGDGGQSLITPTVMPRIHLLSSSQRRRKFMKRGATLSGDFFHFSTDEDRSIRPPHILEELDHSSQSSKSSSNSESAKKFNRPPTLADGSLPSPGFLQPPDLFKTNLLLLERPPHIQVMLR
uniref:CARMIL_C domain-containing protein n=1 Tax=Strongyloides stercoralis TaxID=6248 RepID=A0A0K0E0D8_STRER